MLKGIFVNILQPVQILNAKCRSTLGRATDGKKRTDSLDVLFLLKWLADQGVSPTAQQVPNAVEEFVEWFISIYGGEELWTAAGFDREKGLFHLCYCSTRDWRIMVPSHHLSHASIHYQSSFHFFYRSPLAETINRFLLNGHISKGGSAYRVLGTERWYHHIVIVGTNSWIYVTAHPFICLDKD
jgi:hypothetical protein